MARKVLQGFDSFSHIYLMRNLQKYQKHLIPTVAFWATTEIARPIQPNRQLTFALGNAAFKKPQWNLIFFHGFVISITKRYEKCCHIPVRIFCHFIGSHSHCDVGQIWMHIDNKRLKWYSNKSSKFPHMCLMKLASWVQSAVANFIKHFWEPLFEYHFRFKLEEENSNGLGCAIRFKVGYMWHDWTFILITIPSCPSSFWMTQSMYVNL